MMQKEKEQQNKIYQYQGHHPKKAPFFRKPCIIVFVFSLCLLGMTAVFTDLTKGMEQTFNQKNTCDLIVISETGFTQDDINRIREINTI